MKKNFLPLGSIIKLNEDKRKLMVVAYKAKSKDNDEIFDYAGCLFPEGLMEDYYVLFNKYDVSEVFFEGYADEELDEYTEKISSLSSSNSNGGLEDYSTGNNAGGTKRKRVPGKPTKPLSKSEMYSKYTSKVISGNQLKEFDFSELNK